MQKLILSPYECGQLVPHWMELDDSKLKNLKRMSTRKSNFSSEKRVMCPVGLLISEDGYIINGKHRASYARYKGFNHEAYCVNDKNDIIYHTPHKAYGNLGIEEIVESFLMREKYISLCKNQGVYLIDDLIEKNIDLFH